MRNMPHVLVAAVLSCALLPAPASSQDWPQEWADPEDRPPRVDFSVSAGGVLPTRWSDLVVLGSISSASGIFEQVLTRDLQVEPDIDYTAAVTYWRGRYGFRTQGGFSRSSLKVGAVPTGGASTPFPPALTSIGIDTWTYDVRAAIGFLDYHPGRWIWPYGFFGAGGITYRLKDPVTPPLTFLGSSRVETDGGNTVIVEDDGQQFLLAVDALRTETVFAVNFGIGADFRVPVGGSGVGLRVEVADHVSPSPMRVRIREVSPLGGFVPQSGIEFPLVHHLRATVGVVVHIGS